MYWALKFKILKVYYRLRNGYDSVANPSFSPTLLVMHILKQIDRFLEKIESHILVDWVSR